MKDVLYLYFYLYTIDITIKFQRCKETLYSINEEGKGEIPLLNYHTMKAYALLHQAPCQEDIWGSGSNCGTRW
jgi:hypothetical protein